MWFRRIGIHADAARDALPAAPKLTLMGVSPMVVEASEDCNHHGAMAWDEVDGDLTASVVHSGDVNTFIVGTGQSIVYSVTNSAGLTGSITRAVHVVDTQDGCAGDPCAHGSCADRVLGYLCTCDEYWTGDKCDQWATGACVAGVVVSVCVCATGARSFRCDRVSCAHGARSQDHRAWRQPCDR